MTNTNTFRFFIECIKHYKLLVIGQFIVAVVWAINLSLKPFLVKIMLDNISNYTSINNKIEPLINNAFFYISILSVEILFARLSEFIWLFLNSGLKKHVSLRLMSRMFLHSSSFYQNNFAGNLASKIKDVMSGIPDLSKLFIEKLFSYALALVIAIYTLWQLNPKFAISLIVWMILYLGASFKFSINSKFLCKNAAEARANIIGYLIDVLSNIKSVNLFTTRNWETNKLKSLLNSYVKNDRVRDGFFIKLFTFQGISFVAFQAICIYWLILGLRDQHITAGDFALVLTLNISIVDCLQSLSKDISAYAEIYGNVSQALDTIYTPIEILDSDKAIELNIKKGEIIFDNVKFHYKESSLLFDNSSLRIKPGERVGLVGYSGSGKSTFVNLILRIFDISSGSIIIDDYDIRYISQDSLRNAIAHVPQDPILFHRSLFDNIHYGNIKATKEQVFEAARNANIHDFIMSLPNAYNTFVGERGIKLSGGQRQLVVIARAFLKNASILLLDEATSNLDSITERYIQESLTRLMQNKTTIVIAHRLSTLLSMDRILVFQNGRIIEDGNHGDLLAKGGFYKTLWDTQVGGFIKAF